jgi:hypothetical protein
LSSKSLRSPRMRLTLLCKEQSLRCKGEAGAGGQGKPGATCSCIMGTQPHLAASVLPQSPAVTTKDTRPESLKDLALDKVHQPYTG